ncbi:MAG TPA: apolipoprotein N-acyltransferase [Polyangiaceae bacterium]
MTRVPRYVLALLAGAVLGLGAPPVDAYLALWLGLIAFAWLLETPVPPRKRVALSGAMRGLAFGIGANLVLLRFITTVVTRFTPLPWAAAALALVLLSVFEGLRWMIAGVACETLARVRVPRPIALAAGVYAGTFLPTMLPWTTAGLVSPWPALVQLADIVGERGVTALMALIAGLAASGVRAALGGAATRKRGLLQVGTAVALVLAQLVYGQARMRSVELARSLAPQARVGLLQPSIGASARWDEARGPAILQELTTLTHRAEARGAEVVVWPETAYPFRVAHGAPRSPDGARALVQPGVRGPIIAGVQTKGDADGVFYNSVLVATGDGALSEPYDKRHLLWFGETVPLADRIPWLRRVFARGLGLVAGDHAVALVASPVRASALVCYEDMLPEAGREAMAVSPNLLVNVTNDAWFSGTTEPELHLRVAVLRAVELRRDLVRAVNAGPASWVDATGRVRMRSSTVTASTITAVPSLLDARTVYARFGDAPWAILGLILANLAVWKARRRAKSA